MLKKTIWTLSLVGVLGFVNCGGEGSEEAKKLLQKILQFIGIPQSIIVNVCQDSNRDGICSLTERQTKVTINKGDSVETIWEKISLTEDGRYFLETYNPAEPILVELQDVAKVTYDEGKFTLAFNGFTTKKDDNETKEISILESMVDANALTKTEADKFRNLENTEAQDKYYVALLNTLETNINTLRRNGLDSQTAVRASIVEMGDETKINQEQAVKINACGSDQTCVDGEIKTLSDELIIDNNESQVIVDQNNQSNNNEKDYSQYKGLNFDSLVIKSSRCEKVIVESLSLHYITEAIVNIPNPTPSYTNATVHAFCIDRNKQEKLEINSITSATYRDKNGVDNTFEIKDSYIDNMTQFFTRIEGENVANISLNTFDYFIVKSRTDDDIFNRLTITSVSDNCHDATVDSAALISNKDENGELTTSIRVIIACSNPEEIKNQNENAELNYTDKSGNIHILSHDNAEAFIDSKNIWVSIDKDLKGNSEELSMNRGNILYSAIGFEKSSKEYNVYSKAEKFEIYKNVQK